MASTPSAVPTDLVPVGQIARHEFGATEIQKPAETSAIALAERERSTIQAMFIVARQNPRNIARFEQNILKECERTGFAEVARYRKPVGKKWNPETRDSEQQYAEGFSIRFAEAAMRHWTNLVCDAKSAYEDDQKRIVRMVVMDLESNITISSEFNMGKTVERKGFKKKGASEVTPPEGREILGERLNSYGDKTYTVVATEDELGMKQGANWSKFIRNVLRFMPGDILDACEAQIDKTLKGLGPEAARQRIMDAFDRIGVTMADIQEYVGHSTSTLSGDEINELRKVYSGIKEGESTWKEMLEAKAPAGTKEAAQEVAKQKLAGLGAKKDNPKPQDGGARTAGPVATEPVTGKTDSPAGDRNDRETPASTTLGSEIPLHQASVQQYRAEIGDQAFMRIMGSNGMESIADVTEKNWKVIAHEMDEELKIQREEKAKKDEQSTEPKKRGRLKL